MNLLGGFLSPPQYVSLERTFPKSAAVRRIRPDSHAREVWDPVVASGVAINHHPRLMVHASQTGAGSIVRRIDGLDLQSRLLAPTKVYRHREELVYVFEPFGQPINRRTESAEPEMRLDRPIRLIAPEHYNAYVEMLRLPLQCSDANLFSLGVQQAVPLDVDAEADEAVCLSSRYGCLA